MNKKYIFITMGLLLSINSCKDSNNLISETGSLPSVIYEVEYINHAWGYVHQGFYIKQDGEVHSYNIAKTGGRWDDTTNGYYSGEELAAKFDHLDTLHGTVARDTILWSIALAELAQFGNYSDTVSYGVDMGGRLHTVYIYKPDIKKYRQIVLQLQGDCMFRNESESAKQLVAWMDRVINSFR